MTRNKDCTPPQLPKAIIREWKDFPVKGIILPLQLDALCVLQVGPTQQRVDRIKRRVEGVICQRPRNHKADRAEDLLRDERYGKFDAGKVSMWQGDAQGQEISLHVCLIHPNGASALLILAKGEGGDDSLPLGSGVPQDQNSDLPVLQILEDAWTEAADAAEQDSVMEGHPGDRVARYILSAPP